VAPLKNPLSYQSERPRGTLCPCLRALFRICRSVRCRWPALTARPSRIAIAARVLEPFPWCTLRESELPLSKRGSGKAEARRLQPSRRSSKGRGELEAPLTASRTSARSSSVFSHNFHDHRTVKGEDLRSGGRRLRFPAELSIPVFPVRLGGVGWLRSGPFQP